MYLWAVTPRRVLVYDPLCGHQHISVVFAGGLCDRWAQRALQPVSWSLYESSRCHDIGVRFQKPLAGGSLGFDVPAAVEKLRSALRDPPEGLCSTVLHLADGLIGSKVNPSILQSLFFFFFLSPLLCGESICSYVLHSMSTMWRSGRESRPGKLV